MPTKIFYTKPVYIQPEPDNIPSGNPELVFRLEQERPGSEDEIPYLTLRQYITISGCKSCFDCEWHWRKKIKDAAAVYCLHYKKIIGIADDAHATYYKLSEEFNPTKNCSCEHFMKLGEHCRKNDTSWIANHPGRFSS